MDANHSNLVNLEKVRLEKGLDKCKEVFEESLKLNGLRAIDLLNARTLTFPCLYVLLPQIKAHRLYQRLSTRNVLAIRLVNQITGPKSATVPDYLAAKNNNILTVLKWMVETGVIEDGLSDEYEKIMDVSVSVLLDTYQEKSVFPTVVRMIFTRGKTGHYIHDLVWSCFRLAEPEVLKLIAQRLRSPDRKEAALARELLNLDGSDIPPNMISEKLYARYMNWLNENDPFLYFTDEAFQYSGKPTFSAVDFDRKYFNKGIESYHKQPLKPKDDTESMVLEAFAPLSNEQKAMLSGYSYKLQKKDTSEWEKLMKTPIGEQIRAAKADKEGF